MVTTVAVLGLGRMGCAIARRLLRAGYSVRVWNRTAGKDESVVEAGAVGCSSAAEAIQGCSVVSTSLTDGHALVDLLIARGLVSSLESRAVTIIEHSTIDLDSSRSVADACRASNVGYVRAPISGNASVVESGTATMLVSGAGDVIERCLPVLEAIGPQIQRLGDDDEARVVKLAVNLVIAGTTELLAEAVTLAEQCSVDRSVILAALEASVVSSAFLRYKSDALRGRDYAATFSTLDMRKDVTLALGEADKLGVPLPATRLVGDLLLDADSLGYGSSDFLSLVARLQVRAGVTPDVDPSQSAEKRSD